MDLRKKLMEELEKGKNSANLIRSLLDKLQASKDDQDYDLKQLDEQSMAIINTFNSALSLLINSDFEGDNPNSSDYKPEESSDVEISKNATTKEKRGCYKRRRTSQSWTVVTTNLTDDGFAWRKYGQKVILNTKHPRSYYRCTHKIEQGCQATKQVQQISENPTKYNVIYQGDHTCKNLLKTPIIISESIDLDSSSILVSFETNNPEAKHTLNPFFFQSSSSSLSNATVKPQLYGSIKEEMQSVPHDYHHGAHNQHSSPSDYLSTSPVSEQGDVMSSAEVYSSTASPYDIEEDYTYLMAESLDFGQVFHDMYS